MEEGCSNCRRDILAAKSDLLFVSRHKIADGEVLLNSEDAVPQHIETISVLLFRNDMICLTPFIIMSRIKIENKKM
jgi:hypothetical protein